MSILTFEGLSTTFEASMNVYFTDNTCIKVANKMLFSNNLAIRPVPRNIILSSGCSCKGKILHKLPKYSIM